MSSSKKCPVMRVMYREEVEHGNRRSLISGRQRYVAGGVVGRRQGWGMKNQMGTGKQPTTTLLNPWCLGRSGRDAGGEKWWRPHCFAASAADPCFSS